MAELIGPEGQVVIEQEIRERLGVEPGWQALQLLAGDHVKIYFVPPEHNRSLFGAAKPFIRREPLSEEDSDEDWDEAVGRAIAEEFQREYEPEDAIELEGTWED